MAAPAVVRKRVPSGQVFVTSFSVTWEAPDGSSPPASVPVTITITDPAIRPGDVIYMVTTKGLKAVGTATRRGVAEVSFTTDPAFVVSAVPHIAVVAGKASFAGEKIRVEVRCTTAVPCTGLGAVTTLRGAKLAGGHFAVRAGRTTWVSFKETSAGARIARAGHRQRALVKLLPKGGKPARAKVWLGRPV
ncbi:MAG TPA: hypothetical protein VFN61_01225 [Acidimicrobiales bacterium]|nr:hypothetical protein [Acidimicrobiales bacterium]